MALPPQIRYQQHGREEEEEDRMIVPDARTITGKLLNELWNVGAAHALYHHEGNYYHNLQAFPGALFDPNGYIVFKNQHDYNTCQYLDIKQELHVKGGISFIPGYKQMKS
jgi:hypothetical protein